MLVGGEEEGRNGLHKGHQEDQEHKMTLPTVSNYSIHETTNDSDNGKQEGTYRAFYLLRICNF